MHQTIVIGLGSMGASTLYQLAKRGVKVLGFEQFELGHSNGSHGGQSRIVRKAYFEHPDYVPLLEDAYQGWKELEDETGRKFYHPTGLAYFGVATHPVMEGVKQSAVQYGIQLETLDSDDNSVFDIPGAYEGLLEPEAGFALTDSTIRAYAELAQNHGAEIKTHEQVLSWEETDSGVKVSTDRGEYHAEKLIITAGAYAKSLIPESATTLNITRQLLSWVKPKNPEVFELGNFPCWMICDPGYDGLFYGFPILPIDEFGGNGLLKVAHHVPGESIKPEELHDFNPDTEKAKLEAILKKHIPEALGETLEMTACMYTNSSDEHFVIDHLPETEGRVVIGTGFSGHGFKFVPVIGKVLADLSIQGKTEWPVEFLRLGRFKH